MEASLKSSGCEASRAPRRLRVTERRIEANRRNARRSTGPRTPEGKARVRLNALRHGFRARDEICLAAAGEEAQRQIASTIEGLAESLHPAGSEESAIVAEIAHNMWKADRAFALDMSSRWWETAPDSPELPRMRNWLFALIRYNNRANRMIHRGFDALHRARRLRAASSGNERSKPLARHSRASGPEPGEGPPTEPRSPAEAGATRNNPQP